jgi:hypothetical protein
MLRDILTVYFIVAGCLLLWLNFRPHKVVLTKDDDADVAHPYPEQKRVGRRPRPIPHHVTEGADRLPLAEDGDGCGLISLEADLQRIALEEMARDANPQGRRPAGLCSRLFSDLPGNIAAHAFDLFKGAAQASVSVPRRPRQERGFTYA